MRIQIIVLCSNFRKITHLKHDPQKKKISNTEQLEIINKTENKLPP